LCFYAKDEKTVKLTSYFIPTVREVPTEAETPSHRLMIRSGMIRKIASGVYAHLPIGLRVIRKIENIVREEMNRAGAIETLLPSMIPSELWQETGRWEFYGKELLRIVDRHEHNFCYGPTHEEVMTDLVRREINSYKQLPINLYQIQTKFRDEIRPRFGVMRSREFIMKDGYSFDVDDEGAIESYEKMFKAYEAIFKRSGLNFRAVEADTGQIGGSSSHEFMVLAETGEDIVVSCPKCGYASNTEKTEIIQTDSDSPIPQDLDKIKEVETPDKKSIEEVAEFLDKDTWDFIKTLIYTVDFDKEHIAVLVRGDYDINELKLKKVLDANDIELAEPEIVKEITNAPVGFAGPVGLKCKVIADNSVKGIFDGVTGANKTDCHLLNVVEGRDFEADIYDDIRTVALGDPCPKCRDTLEFFRGIEVGHIFRLGTKYSEAMNATFLDVNGKKQTVVMGTYGIGIARIAAATIEQSHDDNGIIWPYSIAPFEVIVIPLNTKVESVVNTANKIEQELEADGYEVLNDDRNERAGVKFKDSDLIGIPIQIIVGEKGLANNEVEIKVRKTGERFSIKTSDIKSKVNEIAGLLTIV